MAAKKRSESNGLQIPGFRKVETTLGGFWKPDTNGQQVRGIVGQSIQVKGRDGDKPNQFFTLALTTDDGGPIRGGKDGNQKITPERGMIIGVGGKMLITFLHGREGKEVILIYRGLGKAKSGQNAPKLYDTYESIAGDDE